MPPRDIGGWGPRLQSARMLREVLPGVFRVDHPLVDHLVTRLRDKHTGTAEFRALVHHLSVLLLWPVTEEFRRGARRVETPLEAGEFPVLAEQLVVVPILRAGLGMAEALVQVLPEAQVYHLGLYRNEESLEPVVYYSRLPTDLRGRRVLVLDPMLATGGSAAAAVSILKQKGAERVALVSLIAAPEGIRRFRDRHPDALVYAATVDRGLNERGYIVPGLGDAGDRQFGTG